MKTTLLGPLLVLLAVACTDNVQLLQPQDTVADASTPDSGPTPKADGGGDSQSPPVSTNCYWAGENEETFYKPAVGEACSASSCIYRYDLGGNMQEEVVELNDISQIVAVTDAEVLFVATDSAGISQLYSQTLGGLSSVRTPRITLPAGSNFMGIASKRIGDMLFVAYGEHNWNGQVDSFRSHLATIALGATTRAMVVDAQGYQDAVAAPVAGTLLHNGFQYAFTSRKIFRVNRNLATQSYEGLVNSADHITSIAVADSALYWSTDDGLKKGLYKLNLQNDAVEVLLAPARRGSSTGSRASVAYKADTNKLLFNDGERLTEFSYDQNLVLQQRDVYVAGPYLQGHGRILGLDPTTTDVAYIGDLCHEDADAPGYAPRRVNLSTGALEWINPLAAGVVTPYIDRVSGPKYRNSNSVFRLVQSPLQP